MLDSQSTLSPKFPSNQSWTIDSFDTKNVKSKKVIRKFISSAIYVEKPVTEMPPSRKTSPYFLNYDSDSEYTCRTSASIPETNGTTKVKRCSCNSTPNSCPCHNLEEKCDCGDPKTKRSHSNMLESPATNSSSDIESQITVKSKKSELPKPASEMKLSLTSLSTERTGEIDFQEKEKIIKNWLRRKDLEKKRKDIEDMKMREAKETERQTVLEKERENFKRWLADKKQDEEKKKQMQAKEEEEEKLKEAEKEKRQVESEMCFHIWVKKKRRMELEQKIKQKLSLLQVFEEKQRRLEENEKAFDDWLKNSKTKPKPIPLNQGLKSLCSSTSVTYINPTPWIPNIEVSQKPASQ